MLGGTALSSISVLAVMGTIAAGFQQVGVIRQFGVSSGENLVWLLGVSAFTRQGGREPETSYWRSL